MKKTVEATPENLRTLKQRLLAIVAMLLIALILTMLTSFAWLTMSIAPEVSGIVSNIGANGSLEMALLNSDTYSNPAIIKNPNIGESLESDSEVANERWGNLINLDGTSYGLEKIKLYPARLNAKKSANGLSYTLGDSILSIPSYGYDGRIVSLSDNTVSGIYTDKDFSYDVSNLGFGVRAIGTTNNLSIQANYLLKARGNILSYTTSAKTSAISSFSGMENLLIKVASGSNSFNNSDVTTLKTMISRLQEAENYIEKALRQGLVGYAAANLADEKAFEMARSEIDNDKSTLSLLVRVVEEITTINSSFETWVNQHEVMQNALARASATCAALTDDAHTMEEIRPVLNELMDMSKVLFNGQKYSEVDKGELILNLPITISLTPGSGVYADIADFVGNYDAAVGNMANVSTLSAQNPAYLSELHSAVNRLTAAGGGLSNKPIAIGDVYGYALDFAFRCNAFSSDLLLQTAGTQRVYDDSDSAATMGGGSYMEFTTKNTGFGVNDITKLMDAVRVAFVDNQGNILGVAKLNTSNRDVVGDNVIAPLYLYDYSIPETGEDKGKMIMGERRKFDNTLTSLAQNTAKVISTVVWLDGDLVDNTVIGAGQSLSGMLNLQFASSVDLTPAENSALLGYVIDKSALSEDIEAAKATYEKGKQNYTAYSWSRFEDAYNYANTVNALVDSTPMQVQRAGNDLKEKTEALTTVTTDDLLTTIQEVRDVVGKTDVVAGYVLKVEDAEKETTTYSIELVPEGTEYDVSTGNAVYTFNRVDYNKNLHDEGNGYLTRIYSDYSWTNLAKVLYQAEGVAHIGTKSYSEQEIEKANTDLIAAFKGLERSIYYAPYDYQGQLYYKAITEDTDTYGKWYDAQFKRIIDDLTTLSLDSVAEQVNIALPLTTPKKDKLYGTKGSFDLPISLNDDYCSSLSEQTIIADNWRLPDAVTLKSDEKSSMVEEIEFNEITLNVKADTFDVNKLYTNPYSMLSVDTDVLGDHTLVGTLLTDAGVLFQNRIVLSIYDPAETVKINESSQTVTVGNSVDLSCSLVNGTETIESVSWYMGPGDEDIVSINENTGTVTAKKAGTAKVYVLVETLQGNEYISSSSTITVQN